MDCSNAAPTIASQDVTVQAQLVRRTSVPGLDTTGFGMLTNAETDRSNSRKIAEARERYKNWKDSFRGLKSAIGTSKETLTHRDKKSRPYIFSESTYAIDLEIDGGCEDIRQKKNSKRNVSGARLLPMFNSKK